VQGADATAEAACRKTGLVLPDSRRSRLFDLLPFFSGQTDALMRVKGALRRRCPVIWQALSFTLSGP
jgi:hypothetical protein